MNFKSIGMTKRNVKHLWWIRLTDSLTFISIFLCEYNEYIASNVGTEEKEILKSERWSRLKCLFYLTLFMYMFFVLLFFFYSWLLLYLLFVVLMFELNFFFKKKDIIGQVHIVHFYGLNQRWANFLTYVPQCVLKCIHWVSGPGADGLVVLVTGFIGGKKYHGMSKKFALT